MDRFRTKLLLVSLHKWFSPSFASLNLIMANVKLLNNLHTFPTCVKNAYLKKSTPWVFSLLCEAQHMEIVQLQYAESNTINVTLPLFSFEVTFHVISLIQISTVWNGGCNSHETGHLTDLMRSTATMSCSELSCQKKAKGLFLTAYSCDPSVLAS